MTQVRSFEHTATLVGATDGGSAIWRPTFARRAARLQANDIWELLKVVGTPGIISFAGGIPEPSLFPVQAMADAHARIFADPKQWHRALQYGATDGLPELKAWIVDDLAARRGVICRPENVVVTAGGQQALDLLGRVFLDPRAAVGLTTPAYLGALQAFCGFEAEISELSWHDGQWLITGRPPSLLYSVPEFHNPDGSTLGQEQRMSLLTLAAQLGVPLIEDAPYEALRFDGGPATPPLLALDIEHSRSIDNSRVIYCGTVSKTIVPGLRVGWLVARRDVAERVVLAKQAVDVHTGVLAQMALAAVLPEIFEQQITRARAMYRERRDAALQALAAHMPKAVSWTQPEGGLFIWVTLPEGLDARAFLRWASDQARVVFVPGDAFYADGRRSSSFRLSYSLTPPHVIAEGVARLGRALESFANLNRGNA
jgi:DNA-binding transcriptional MocR family regulator